MKKRNFSAVLSIVLSVTLMFSPALTAVAAGPDEEMADTGEEAALEVFEEEEDTADSEEYEGMVGPEEQEEEPAPEPAKQKDDGIAAYSVTDEPDDMAEEEDSEEEPDYGIATYSTTASGSCGSNATWNLSSGTLTISGSGKMTDYSSYSSTPWYSYRNEITKIVVSSGITSIGTYGFSYCTATSVSLPSSLVTIGDNAFYRCTELTSVTIPNSVTSIGMDAFEFCSSMTKATVGSGVTVLEQYAFLFCDALKTVTIKSGVQKINNYAFYCCDALTSVSIPKSVTFIGKYAFYECGSFTPSVPSTLTKIEDGSYMAVDTVKVKGTCDYEAAYEVLDLVNAERKAQGLSSLTMDKDLLDAAMQRAAECSLLFEHTRPTGLSCSSASTKISGENIALGYPTASAVMSGWMNSSGHKANILGSGYKSIGIGCYYNGGVIYWVQDFGGSSATKVSQPSNKTKTFTIAVDPDEYSNLLSLTVSSSSLNKGSSTTMTAKLDGTRLVGSSLKWSSSDTSIATVSSSGKVTGKKDGTVTIKAKTKQGHISASKKIKVKTKVELSATSKTLGYKQSFNLSVKNTGSKTVKWSTSDKKVAKIKKVSKTKYKVTGVKPGTATIKVKVGSKTYKCKITVKNICHTSLSLAKGKTHTLSLTGTSGTVKWSTSDSKVVSIKRVNNKKYKITAKKKGTATIKAKVKGKTYKCKVTVTNPKLSNTSKSLTVGNSFNLSVSGGKGTVTWSTSDKSVATIKKVSNTKYKVTGKKKGTATIKAKVDGKTLKCKVKVKK